MPTDTRLLLQTAAAPASWGTTYVVMTELLPTDRPLLAALGRALPAGVLLAVLFRGLPTGSWWWRAPLLGTLNVGGFFALLMVAADRLPGGVAATLGAVGPLLVALLAWPLLGTRPVRRVVAAGVAAVAGVALLVLTPAAALDPVGIAAGLGATVSTALGIVLTRRFGPPPAPLLVATGWQLMAASALLLPLALAVEGTPPTPDGSALIGFGWLALVGTALAYALWFRGLAALPTTRVAFLVLLSPVVAATLGWAALGQSLSPLQLAGMAVALGSIVAAQGAALPRLRRRRLSERAAPAPSPLAPRPGARPA